MGDAGCWNPAHQRDSHDRSGNPPVTQVATPLIMQNFIKKYNSVIKKIIPLTVVMKGKICYIDQNIVLHQAVNRFFLL